MVARHSEACRQIQPGLVECICGTAKANEVIDLTQKVLTAARVYTYSKDSENCKEDKLKLFEAVEELDNLLARIRKHA